MVLLDTGVRLSELVVIKLNNIDNGNGHIKVLGKGGKEQMVRMGKAAQKALWRYSIYRAQNGRQDNL